MNKPIVFNYKDYKDLKEAYAELLEENAELKRKLANAEIHLRILNEDLDNYKPRAEQYEKLYEMQRSTIEKYHKVFKLQEAELEKLRGAK